MFILTHSQREETVLCILYYDCTIDCILIELWAALETVIKPRSKEKALRIHSKNTFQITYKAKDVTFVFWSI